MVSIDQASGTNASDKHIQRWQSSFIITLRESNAWSQALTAQTYAAYVQPHSYRRHEALKHAKQAL